MKSFCLRRSCLILPPLFAAMAPAEAATPSYIKADRAAVEKAFGVTITGNIFSEQLTPSRKKLVVATLKNNPVPGCKGIPAFTLVGIAPLQANAEGTAWEERYELACEPRVRRSALITVSRKTGLQMRESVPGDSIADIKLRNQFLPKLLETAGAPSCDPKQIKVVDSRTVTTPDKAAAPWTELWTVNACGASKDIEVALTPNESGGGTTWQFTVK